MGRLIARRSPAATALALALLVVAALVPGAVSAVDVTWGDPKATASYGERIVFEQPATLPAGIARLEILIEAPGGFGPGVEEIAGAPSGRTMLRHTLELAAGHILPNTTLTARWRVTGDDGSESTGPPVTVTYRDSRFEWQTREGEVVRVHWYAGSEAFGERALEIGERAVAETAQLLGVTEEEPVDFFVYADQQEFYDALGPATRENVGGQANAEIRTLFALITPGEIDDPWVDVVIPHELVHLVFDTAVDNPYHFPPRWLNEGLATYLSEGYGAQYRGAVEAAASNGSLIPLEGLTGQFPTTYERFNLAYAESVSAVDFLIRTHGQDAMVQLVRSYASGRTDDEAFEQAIGMDTEAFDAAWRGDLDAAEPTEHGPRPAPPGPLPPGWQTADGSPAPSGGAIPGSSGGPGAPLPGAGTGDGSALLMPLALVVSGLVAAGLVAYVVAGRRREAERARVAQFASWRDERMSPARTAAEESVPAGAPTDPMSSAAPTQPAPPLHPQPAPRPAETWDASPTIPIETWPPAVPEAPPSTQDQSPPVPPPADDRRE